MRSLKIANNQNCNIDFQKNDDPVLNAINKYKYDSSIFKINNKIEPENIFSFTIVKHEDILRKTKKNLNVSEASQQSDVSTKMLIENSEYIYYDFYKNMNYFLDQSLFPHDLK